MSIVSCPRCGDKVSVPPAASPTALVQCPLCREEYFLSDALIQLPPMLVVVGGHAATADKEADYRLAEPVGAAVREANFETAGLGTGSVTTSRPQLRTVSRPRRPEKSAVGEIIKVVLGGAAGLAGGLLVLWWGFGVDVGQLGPKLSKVQYLRYLVPQKLWDQSVQTENEAAQIAPLDTVKQANGKGKSGRAATGTDQVAGDSTQRNAATTNSGGDDAPAKKTKQADPFLTLDDLGAASTAPSSGAAALNIDDPLSAVTPPKSGEASKADDTKAAPQPAKEETKAKGGKAKPDAAPEEKAAEEKAAEEKVAEPTKGESAPSDNEKGAKENPAQEKSRDDEPAAPKSDGDQKEPSADEAKPE